MKPHCMFFDEAYSEEYYRKDSIKKFYDEADCIIVVGTQFATTMAKILVSNCLSREIPVIEVNLETAINVGNNI